MLEIAAKGSIRIKKRIKETIVFLILRVKRPNISRVTSRSAVIESDRDKGSFATSKEAESIVNGIQKIKAKRLTRL